MKLKCPNCDNVKDIDRLDLFLVKCNLCSKVGCCKCERKHLIKHHVTDSNCDFKELTYQKSKEFIFEEEK